MEDYLNNKEMENFLIMESGYKKVNPKMRKMG
jgi:hypothetical protein